MTLNDFDMTLDVLKSSCEWCWCCCSKHRNDQKGHSKSLWSSLNNGI